MHMETGPLCVVVVEQLCIRTPAVRLGAGSRRRGLPCLGFRLQICLQKNNIQFFSNMFALFCNFELFLLETALIEYGLRYVQSSATVVIRLMVSGDHRLVASTAFNE